MLTEGQRRRMERWGLAIGFLSANVAGVGSLLAGSGVVAGNGALLYLSATAASVVGLVLSAVILELAMPTKRTS